MTLVKLAVIAVLLVLAVLCACVGLLVGVDPEGRGAKSAAVLFGVAVVFVVFAALTGMMVV